MQGLYTIGYERATPAELVETLDRAGVDVLVDVREAPVSRRPGFSRRALAATLVGAGIGYRHEGGLGAPKPIRDRVRQDGELGAFFDAYREHLAGRAALLERLAAEIAGAAALLCLEADPRRCHRLLVAEALAARTGLTPVHLKIGPPGPPLEGGGAH